jgi:cellulose synthase/poly-beta-1,6-N-acetylglucosamine synthase-like glycosyltransferase
MWWHTVTHGRGSEGETGEWNTLPRNMVYPALLPLMRTPRLPVVDWTDAPADLNGLARFAERRNLVSARVPSHFKRSLTSTGESLRTARRRWCKVMLDSCYKHLCHFSLLMMWSRAGFAVGGTGVVMSVTFTISGSDGWRLLHVRARQHYSWFPFQVADS